MILKLKRTPGIYLVGFMGCGKTTVGQVLAGRLGWPFIDIDDDIERAAAESISRIFEHRGEAEFRRIEHEAILRRVRSIEAGHPGVVALGGGAFAQADNFELVKNNGISVCLDCPVETAWERVCLETHRPLARDAESFRRLYAARRPKYLEADCVIEVAGRDPAEVVDAILAEAVFRV
jgi:shikimate kinase